MPNDTKLPEIVSRPACVPGGYELLAQPGKCAGGLLVCLMGGGGGKIPGGGGSGMPAMPGPAAQP